MPQKGKKSIGSGIYNRTKPAWNKGKSGMKYPDRKSPPPFTEEHKRKIRENAQWREKNVNWKGGVSLQKGYKTHQRKRYKIRKLGNGGSHTFGEWLTLTAQYNWTCPCCRRNEPQIKLTRDHIIAISKGGSDNIENIQPLCQSCNSKKQTKEIKY